MRYVKRDASDAERLRPWIMRHEFTGLELDWLAVDRLGHVAMFSTAGYGPVPLAAIEHITELDTALDQAMQLPVIGSAENLAMDRGGNYSEWHNYSARGFYAYDWHLWDGPYQRLSAPSNPVSIGQLPAEIQLAARLVEFDADFAGEAQIIWFEYVEPLPG